MIKKTLTILILVLILFPSVSFASGIIPCGRSADDPSTPNIIENSPCTLCHLVVGIKKLVDFGTEVLITVAAVGIFISGVMYVVSSGDEESVKRAKEFLGSSLKGFAIVLGAWFIVNVTMWALSFNSDMIKKGSNWYTFTCDMVSSSYKGEETSEYSGDTFGYTYDPGIQLQMADASSELKDLLTCMQPKLPGGAKRISSISDSAGMGKCVSDYQKPPCAHTQYSCHYGGRNCNGKSYAADFGNENLADQIQSAAVACGGKSLIEGNHVHVSIGNCGCDNNV